MKNLEATLMRDAVLTTKVISALINFEINKKLDEREKSIIKRGSDIIKEIIAGFSLLENIASPYANKTDLGRGIELCGYVFEILKKEEYKSIYNMTNYFEQYFVDLQKIKNEDEIDTKNLKDFFLFLGDHFRRAFYDQHMKSMVDDD